MSIVFPAVKDKQTISKEGKLLSKHIDGINLKRLNPIEDDRGELMELMADSWGYHDTAISYVYQVRIKPKKIKGWVVHKKQDDRIVPLVGTIRVVLYDLREDSPTYQLLNEFVFSERNPTLITFPIGVFHAVQNIGTSDAIFLNMPTRPYNHEDPDKFRLPINNEFIPYRFDT